MYYAVERSPSFTHAGTGRVIRKHKYLLKVPGPKNSYRYLYTQEEVDAYRNSKTQREAAFKANFNNQVDKVKQAVSDASGLTAKKDRERWGGIKLDYDKEIAKMRSEGDRDSEGYKIVSQIASDAGKEALKAYRKYKSSPVGKIDDATEAVKKTLKSANKKISKASAKIAERQQNVAKAEKSLKKYNSAMSQKLKNTTDLAKAVVSNDTLFTPGGGYERRLAGRLARDRAEAVGAQARYKAVKKASGSKTRPHQRKKKVVSGTATVNKGR